MKRIVVLTILLAAGAISYVAAQQGGQKPMVVEVQKLKDNAKSYTIPAKFQGYTPAQEASVRAAAQVVYDELDVIRPTSTRPTGR